jgi:hypothetical protein
MIPIIRVDEQTILLQTIHPEDRMLTAEIRATLLSVRLGRSDRTSEPPVVLDRQQQIALRDFLTANL